ncbi:MAG: TlpA family protein disulfide reductase [Armatimonadetes bacterium]|nr:TlpA family protein disulfide reductase [Armatimonadota bacterium]
MKKVAFGILLLAAFALIAGCPKPQTEDITPTPKQAGAAEPDQQAEPTFSAGVTEVDEMAPDFTIKDTEGNDVTKADFSGKILVLDFWSTTCSSCVKKLDEYVPIYEKYKDKGVEWLAVSLDPKPEVAAGGAKQHNWPYRVAMFDEELKASYFADESTVVIPQVRIIDRDGNLRYSFKPDSTAADLDLALSKLVDETVGGDESVTKDIVAEEEAAETDEASGAKSPAGAAPAQ